MNKATRELLDAARALVARTRHDAAGHDPDGAARATWCAVCRLTQAVAACDRAAAVRLYWTRRGDGRWCAIACGHTVEAIRSESGWGWHVWRGRGSADDPVIARGDAPTLDEAKAAATAAFVGAVGRTS